MMNDERAPRTASDAVRHDYYGLPVIKAPHWRWLVIVYFFLGAIAGGSATIATIADFVSQDRKLVRAARYLAFAAVTPCPALLVLDLGRPERAFNMFRVLKLRSPMSLGSWALLFLGVLSSVLGMLQAVADVTGREIPTVWRRALGVVTVPFAVFLSGYTAVLLAATNVPLWARNYLLLGPTFVASAFSSSFAALSLVLGLGKGEREDTAQRLARVETVCLTTELVALVGGLLHLGRLGRPLTTGRYGRIFWPVTVLGGIVLPLGLQLSGPVRGNPGSRGRRAATSLLVLVGGFAFRSLMIFAGRESANRPQDYFEYTRKK